MSKRRDTENRRALEAAGWGITDTKAGKRFWQHSATGERRVEDAALELLRQEQVRKLRKAGWEPVEVEGHTYWRKPDSGRLYPRRAALYVSDYANHRRGGGS